MFDLSIDHLVGPFDNALAGLCRWGRDEGRLEMRCLSVTPPLFVHHKAKGWVNGDSDFQLVGGGKKGELREVGTTEDIVWSARSNIMRHRLYPSLVLDAGVLDDSVATQKNIPSQTCPTQARHRRSVKSILRTDVGSIG